MNIINHLIGAAQGKHPLTVKRSDHWTAVRAAHLKIQPICAVCGGNAKLEVHHKSPFHLHPELELDPNNLITLCESDKGGLNCHLAIGHLGNFKSFNPDVSDDAPMWYKKISNRPKVD